MSRDNLADVSNQKMGWGEWLLGGFRRQQAAATVCINDADEAVSTREEEPALFTPRDIPTRPSSTTLPGKGVSFEDVENQERSLTIVDSGDSFTAKPFDPTASAASNALLLETQSHYVRKTLLGLSFPYALFITAIYCLFAIRRSEGDVPLAVLFGVSSVLYNVFGALLFPKKLEGAIADYEHRHDDFFYKGNLTVSSVLSLMTVLASVAVSESSVSDWPEGLLWLAVGCFGLNTALTRFIGGIDLFDRVRRNIEFYTVYKFLNEFTLKADLIEENTNSVLKTHLPESTLPITWVLAQMNAVSASPSQVAKEWGLWGARVFLAAATLTLIPMWISLTQTGMNKLHKGLGDYTGLTTVSALSNALFYGISCYDALPVTIDLYKKLSTRLHETLAPCVPNAMLEQALRHALLMSGFAALIALAYFSGGGFGASVIAMEKHGFGSASDAMTPDWFFVMMQGMYSYVAQSAAGLVNLNSTVRFVLGVLKKQDELPGENVGFAMLNFMKLYEREAPGRLSLASTSTTDALVSVEERMFDSVDKMLKEMRASIEQSKFVQQKLGDGRRHSCRDLLKLSGGPEVSVPEVEELYKNRHTLTAAGKTSQQSCVPHTEKTSLLSCRSK